MRFRTPDHPSQDTPSRASFSATPWLDTLAWYHLSQAKNPIRPPSAGLDASYELTHCHQALQGFLRYQNQHNSKPALSSRPIVWSRGHTQVYDGAPELPAGSINLLCIPSLINRAAVFDGAANASFLDFMRDHQVRPFLVDWGEPGPDEATLSVEGYILQRLLPAYQVLQKRVPGAWYVMGYCVGGLLALGLTHHAPAQGMILMATPWHFGAYPRGVRSWAAWASCVTDFLGCFPGFLLQQAFQALSGPALLKKFETMQACSEAELVRFTEIEDWLNDPVSLGAPAAHTLFQDWFQENQLFQNTWSIGGKPITLASSSIPALVVTSSRDTIVPQAVSAPLCRMPHAHPLDVPLGHVGLMASAQAPRHAWKPMVSWLHQACHSG